MVINPCLSCGACCAYFRASFYWAESTAANESGVPVELTDKLNDFRLVMKGTDCSRPRCIALTGVIGERVACAIYAQRSSVCRAFDAAWLNNEPNERCDRAREAWGLAPLTPASWQPERDFPKAA